jgi:hypothetical protein
MKNNYYGFDHTAVVKKFEGDLSYLGDFMVAGNLWAVYKNSAPNKEKGHKEYMMLCPTHISGMDEERMQKNRYHEGVTCLECNETLFSSTRHDCKTCSCPNETLIDGGGEYTRYGGADLSKVKKVKFDCLDQKFVE